MSPFYIKLFNQITLLLSDDSFTNFKQQPLSRLGVIHMYTVRSV